MFVAPCAFAWHGQAQRRHALTLGRDGCTEAPPVVEAWRQVADDVRGEAVAGSAHYVHEQQPEATVRHIMRFADELEVP